MVIYHGRIRKQITLNKSKFPLLSLHVLVTLPKERPSGSGIMIDLAGHSNLHQQKFGGNGFFLKEPDSLEDHLPGLGDVLNNHGDRTYFPLRIGQRGNPSK